jgi:hypothetical protein
VPVKRTSYIIIPVFFFLLTWLFTQDIQAMPKINPKGVSGYAGAGIATFAIKNPPSRFKLDQGMYATLGGEKGFGFMNLYLTFSLNYLTTQGQADYNYSTLSGQTYTASDVNLQMDLF